MNRRSVVTAMVIAASMLTSEAMYAAPAVAMHSPVLAMFSHEKMVSFSMKNATSAPITVKAGEKEMTVAAGQTVALKLPLGTKVVSVNDTKDHPAGTVVVEVGSQLSDATVVFN
jgi:hypothetical protein